MHREKGEELFKKIIANLESIAKIDSEPKMEGKQVIMIVSPLSSVQ
jgi:translation initiation factor IF-3